MSYSRWSSSCWYTFSDMRMINNEPTLTLMDHWSKPMSDLKKNKSEILGQLRNKRFNRNPLNYHGQGVAPKDRFTEEEIQELSQIIDYFINDNHE